MVRPDQRSSSSDRFALHGHWRPREASCCSCCSTSRSPTTMRRAGDRVPVRRGRLAGSHLHDRLARLRHDSPRRRHLDEEPRRARGRRDADRGHDVQVLPVRPVVARGPVSRRVVRRSGNRRSRSYRSCSRSTCWPARKAPREGRQPGRRGGRHRAGAGRDRRSDPRTRHRDRDDRSAAAGAGRHAAGRCGAVQGDPSRCLVGLDARDRRRRALRPAPGLVARRTRGPLPARLSADR